MQRLGQDIGGLRSAATTQFLLLAQPTVIGQHSYLSNKFLKTKNPFLFSTSSDGFSPVGSHAQLGSIEETLENGSSDTNDPTSLNTLRHPSSDETESVSLPHVNSPSDIFTRFIIQLGPSMVST